MSRSTLAARLWSKVDRTETCWLFTGYRNAAGYGSIHLEGRPEFAHRAAWIVTHGDIPSGMVILHTCDNPPCVNPDHLRVGTDADNAHDMVSKGRHRPPRGAAAPAAKLTDEAVREIRRSALSDAALAALYGVSDTAVFNVRHRRSWRHVA